MQKHIDIPYLPESMEYVVIRLIIGVIVNAVRKQWDIQKAKDNALDLKIPSDENLSEYELEQIIV